MLYRKVLLIRMLLANKQKNLKLYYDLKIYKENKGYEYYTFFNF